MQTEIKNAPHEASDVVVKGRRLPSVWPRVGEVLGVLLSPAILFYVLRLRPMAKQEVTDVARHATYIFDPRDFILRYSTRLPASDLREGARVGFLVPARLAYLIFGAVPGFFATRYFFALVAIVPTYMLLRRLYGVGAGVLGIIVVMSSPVIVTAWGTDFPDSAAVSYLAGGLACLAMPSAGGRRMAWLALAGALLNMAVWSFASAIPLVGVSLVGYVVVMFFRERRNLLRDLLVLAISAAACTGLLVIGSALEIGRANFFSLTWTGTRYLMSGPAVNAYHSTNWAWAPYQSYLLVLPAVVAAWLALFVRRGVGTPQLVVGVACIAQIVTTFYLQFFGSADFLEFHFSSSLLWGASCVTIAIVLSEIAAPLFTSRILQWLPALIAVVVPLLYEAYEANNYMPAFGWTPIGLFLLLLIIAAALVGRRAVSRLPQSVTESGPAPGQVPRRPIALISGILIVVLGAGLILTVAPAPAHAVLKGTSKSDAWTWYDLALGNDGSANVDMYRIQSKVHSFVGNATYQGELLLLWNPHSQFDELYPYIGLFYDGPNEIPDFPHLTKDARSELLRRQPAEILMSSTSGAGFSVALRSLKEFRPRLDRVAVMRSGPVTVHFWLITLRQFMGST